jgi:hypothetical protein
MKSLYNQIVDMGERAEHMADVLLRERDDHGMHRIGVCLRDNVADLSDDVHIRLAKLEQA